MKVLKEFDLTYFNSYRIKSSCSTAYFPESEDDVISFFAMKKPFVLLGSGHNVILSKEFYDLNFLIFNGNYNSVRVDVNEGMIEADSGINMLDLSNIALENGLSGLEIFYDIPSSLGGAVVMNAGASGEEIKDILIKVRYLDLHDMKVKEIAKEYVEFDYRNSFFQKNSDKVVLNAQLQLQSENKNIIKEKMEFIKQQRWAKQPKEFPNAGSVFKRPKGFYVGALIDELGLKGFKIGGAMISEKHSGFIVNFNNANGKDILNIIEVVQDKVRKHYNIDLEVEQRVI
jgi:UDP-N-acetylmuramate dehydrogenase